MSTGVSIGARVLVVLWAGAIDAGVVVVIVVRPVGVKVATDATEPTDAGGTQFPPCAP